MVSNFVSVQPNAFVAGTLDMNRKFSHGIKVQQYFKEGNLKAFPAIILGNDPTNKRAVALTPLLDDGAAQFSEGMIVYVQSVLWNAPKDICQLARLEADFRTAPVLCESHLEPAETAGLILHITTPLSHDYKLMGDLQDKWFVKNILVLNVKARKELLHIQSIYNTDWLTTALAYELIKRFCPELKGPIVDILRSLFSNENEPFPSHQVIATNTSSDLTQDINLIYLRHGEWICACFEPDGTTTVPRRYIRFIEDSLEIITEEARISMFCSDVLEA